MRLPAFLCLLALATRAYAAAPEQPYLDLRDRHIAKFSKAKESDEIISSTMPRSRSCQACCVP